MDAVPTRLKQRKKPRDAVHGRIKCRISADSPDSRLSGMPFGPTPGFDVSVTTRSRTAEEGLRSFGAIDIEPRTTEAPS